MATALVLSAGGMYGAWEVGVWKALSGRFHPDLIVGASAGSWIGWAIAGGCEIDELAAIWLDPSTAAILQPGVYRRFRLPRPDVLYAKAREMFERFRPRIPFGLTVVELPGLRPRVVRDSEMNWEYLAAACSIPVFFPPVRIDGKLYVDGGLKGALPLWAAEQMGADCVIAANVLTALPFRALRCVFPPPRATAALKVKLIEPSVRLGPLRDAMRWSRANAERWIELGERDANRTLSSITM